MEQAGCAVAAAACALLAAADRRAHARALILCGPGNNGGDGLVAARRLAERGIGSEVVLLAGEGRPGRAAARLNWDRLEGIDLVRRVSTARSSDVALYLNGIERAGLVIDALLGTGVRGLLREPVRTAVDVAVRARRARGPRARRRHADRARPHQRRALRPGRPGRCDGDLPSAQAGPAAAGPVASLPGASSWRPSASPRRPIRCLRSPTGGSSGSSARSSSSSSSRAW